MRRIQTPGQMEIFENGPNTTSDPTVETVTRYRVALVKEEDTAYGDLSLTHPDAVAQFLNRVLADRPQEHMTAVYLDTRNRLIGWTIAHIGTINRAAVEPRTIFQIALGLNAAGLILLFRSRNKRHYPDSGIIPTSGRQFHTGRRLTMVLSA